MVVTKEEIETQVSELEEALDKLSPVPLEIRLRTVAMRLMDLMPEEE